MYVCKVCSLVFENKGSYMNHCKTHRTLVEVSDPYVCECGFSTTNAQAYSGHRGKCKVAHPDITFDNYKGRHWNQVSWIKGLTKETDSRVKKISESMKKSDAALKHIREMNANRTVDSYKKMSETRLRKFKSGELLPPKGAGRGKYSYLSYGDQRILLRSTYEFIYALYLLYNGIDFEYESVVVPSVTDYKYAKTFRSDFLVGNTIIEIKGYDSSKVNHARLAFEDSGYDYEVKYWKDIFPCYEYLKSRLDIDSILESIVIGHDSKNYYEYTYVE